MAADPPLPHHYALLGLAPDAEPDAIKRAWKRLAARWHPDADPASAGRFQALHEAWDVLSDPARRAAYDQALQASVQAAVEAMSRLGGVQKLAGITARVIGVKERVPEVGRNRRLRLSVAFDEAVRGTTREAELEGEVKCEACEATGCSPVGRTWVCERCGGIGEVLAHGVLRSSWGVCRDCAGLGWVPEPRCAICEGRGVVTALARWPIPIPAGTRDGQVLRVQGAGEPGPMGGAPGDLLVEVEVRTHPFLSVVGRDLRCERPVPFWLALTGGRIEVPTLEGRANISLPRGTRTGDVLRMSGWGLGEGEGRGDQLVTITVEWPGHLGQEDLERLRDWASALPARAFPETTTYEARLGGHKGQA